MWVKRLDISMEAYFATAQTKTKLIRKLKTMEPDYQVVIFDDGTHTFFRMVDQSEQFRSEKIMLPKDRVEFFDTRNIRRKLELAGFPGKFEV
jgi:hypothetical protein